MEWLGCLAVIILLFPVGLLLWLLRLQTRLREQGNAITDLTLTSDDIGPLDFGDEGSAVLGQLVATFGAPDADTGFIQGSGAFGECPGDTIRVVNWGPLAIVTQGSPEDYQFVSYRMDLRFGGVNSTTTDIATLSGLRVGDTVAQLQSTYAQFLVEFIVDAQAGLVFELRSERSGPLLLWGPVQSQSDDGVVTGIYSPDSCQL